jgi:serine/threonine protein kinase
MLKSLYKAKSDHEFPFVVRFGDRFKQEFSIHKRLSIGSDSITYQAFRKAGDFVTTIPVIIKAYRRGMGKHPIRAFINDVDFLKKDSKRVTLDSYNLIVAFNKEDSQEDTSAETSEEDYESELLLDSLIEPNWTELPYTILLGSNKDDEYMVKRFIGRGRDGVVYEGYRASDAMMKPVIIKSYLRNEYNMEAFQNEEFALEQQSRLIHADPNHMIIVQIKIDGDTLGSVISSLILSEKYAECEELLDRYSAVPRKFRDRFGLVHNDAHPDNIIVDRDDVLHLIDFGKTVLLSDDKIESAKQVRMDDKVVAVWIEIFRSLMNNRRHTT